jgi:anhydro-N-acetylmuramic acid kinase
MQKMNRLLRKRNRLVIGLMSGTSADGIDACLVKIDNAKRNLNVMPLGCRTYRFPQELRQKIIQVSDPSYQDLDEVLRLNMVLGEHFAHAAFSVVKASGYGMEEIDLIGSHGQTVRHLPEWKKRFGRRVRATFQIGEPSVIASKTGVITVGDFRGGDVARGGQGAPLAPYVHYLLFGDKKVSRMVINIGGIANVTVLPKGGSLNDVFAFDTGPGNMVVDALMIKLLGKSYDKDGKIASSGKINSGLLNRLKKNEYFRRRPPKSCGREDFGEEFMGKLLKWAKDLRMREEDIIVTASEFSVWSIMDAYRRFIRPKVRLDQVLLCGGGVHNRYFLKRLRILFAPVNVASVRELAVDPDFLEAISFAILANQTIEGKPVSFRKTTGAKKIGVLGKICLP